MEGLLRDPDAPAGFSHGAARSDHHLSLPQFVNEFLGRGFPIRQVLSPVLSRILTLIPDRISWARSKQRLPNEESLSREGTTLERKRKDARAVIRWGFTTQNARCKLRRLYPFYYKHD